MTPTVTWQSNPPEKLLKERFRISTGFHPGQRDIIEQLVQGKRLLVIQFWLYAARSRTHINAGRGKSGLSTYNYTNCPLR